MASIAMPGYAGQAATCAEVLIFDPNRGNRVAYNHRMALLGFALIETALLAPLDHGSPWRGRLLRYQPQSHTVE